VRHLQDRQAPDDPPAGGGRQGGGGGPGPGAPAAPEGSPDRRPYRRQVPSAHLSAVLPVGPADLLHWFPGGGPVPESPEPLLHRLRGLAAHRPVHLLEVRGEYQECQPGLRQRAVREQLDRLLAARNFVWKNNLQILFNFIWD